MPPDPSGAAVVLIVEDNEMNRDMLSRRLRRHGYDVRQAGDAPTGIAMAQQGGVHLILMDMSLPEIDGWAATRILKGDPATQAIPVMALTAHAMVGDRQAALDAGCDEYETKPVNLEALLTKMSALLAGRRAA